MLSGAISNSTCLCAFGYYQKRVGQTFCNKCDRGKYKNFTGIAQCIYCSEGYYQDQLGSSVCKTCDAGKYNGRIGQKQECSCTSCPQYSTTLDSAATDISLCTCKPGYFGESTSGNGSCSICPAGTAKNFTGFSPDCQDCSDFDPQSTTDPSDQNPPISCQCQSGWTGPDYGNCSFCELGTYKEILGSSQCLPCPINYYSDDSRSDCVPCPNNTVLTKRQGQVSDCVCNAGFTGKKVCLPCDPGTIKPNIGSGICYDCPAGTYALSSTFCKRCPARSSSPNRSSLVQNCSCDPGYTVDLDTTTQLVCIPCPVGTYKLLSGPSSCILDPPNTKKNNQIGAVIFECKPAFAVNQEQNNCTPCSFFHVNAVQNKSFCNITEYFAAQQCACNACPNNQVAYMLAQFSWDDPENGSDISAIPGINGQMEGAQSVQGCVCQSGYECIECPYCSVCENCDACQTGYYKDSSGNDNCIPCPMDLNSSVLLNTSETGSANVSECTCPAGYIVLEDMLPELHCAPCEPGTYSNTVGSTFCSFCDAGFTSAAGSSSCRRCRQGESDVCVCNVGTTLNLSSTYLCSQCSPGTYKNVIGSQPCTPCLKSLEFQSFSGSTACKRCTPTKRCPPGMFWQTCSSSYDGACVPCSNPKPENSRYNGPGSPLNSDTCPSKCGDGYQANSKGECEACLPGNFKSSSLSNCTRCPQFSTTVAPAQTACTRCLDGYYLSGFADGGHAICTRCSALHTTVVSSGIISGSYFSDSCKCEQGYFGCPWNCTMCPPGTYKNYVSFLDAEECVYETCALCPNGTFNIFSGQDSITFCKTCDNTTLGSEDNRTGCICPPNLYFVPDIRKCINSTSK